MDFFKSVFANDLDPSISPDSTSSSSAEPDTDNHPEPNSEPNPNTSVWSFNNLIKTLATKSETYRRDFNDGLMKEASVISSVVDKGTTVAQESLESVGQAIDDIGSTVSHIISYGIAYNNNNDNNDNDNDNDISISSNGKAYSRYENQLRVLQCDEATYCREIDDKDREEYERWKEGFVIDKGLVSENVVGMEIFNNVVPSRVADRDVFWTRYFYRVYKLRQVEDARVRLVKRFMDGEDDEDLGWDYDDDNDDDDDKVESSVGKGSDISIVPSQEEDLRSDEIVGNGSKGELRKQRVSSADADKDEDLSWDIEDDEEEQVK